MIKEYIVKTTQVKIKTSASSKEAAIKNVINYENCPRSAILDVWEAKTPLEVMKTQVLKWKPSDIKRNLDKDSQFFFSRDTMRFFCDKMAYFSCRTIGGTRYLFRKPNTPSKCGFNAWKVRVNDNMTVSVLPCSKEEETLVWDKI